MEMWVKLPSRPADLHQAYNEYMELYQWQMGMIAYPSFYRNFRTLILDFPNLQSLREIPWDEGYFDEPWRRRNDVVDSLAWYQYILKPKDITFKEELGLHEMWEGTDVDRPSILQARTIAANLFLRAFAPAIGQPVGPGSMACQSLDVSLALNSWSTSEMQGATEKERDMHRKLWIRLFRSLSIGNISNLTQLKLNISYVAYPDSAQGRQSYTAFGRLLSFATSLEELSISVQVAYTDADREKDLNLCEHIRDVPLPKLRKLVLLGASTDPGHLEEFLRNQAQTLENLELHDLSLLTRTVCWGDLLKKLPLMLSLRHFEASCLCDEGNTDNNFQHFIGPHSSKLPELQQYVCHQGPWIEDLDSAIDESTCHEVIDDDPGLNWL
jgi:hypothetical protein